jgi:GR25 family glycosyltransferase involved in LPS biosynthesis
MNGFYINLAYRNDRREHFEKLQKDFPFFKNIKRMEAVFSKNSLVGCTSSHINCLTECLKLTDNYYLIMEDDFLILNKNHFNNFIKEFEKIKNDKDWDMITLTPRGNHIKRYFKPKFHKIMNTRTTTAYIIKHKFIKKLLDVYKQSVHKLIQGYNGPKPNPYCTDQCWKPLQLQSTWLFFHQIFAGQLVGYSDIENTVVDYNNYNGGFLSQNKLVPLPPPPPPRRGRPGSRPLFKFFQ